MDLTIEKIEQYFEDLTGFKPRNFQKETIKNLLESKNTILKAPTGSGKTETAIAPYIIALFLIMMEENCSFPNDIKEQDRKRVIVICNTVSVSQGLFGDLEALVDNDDIVVTLLHSRFLPGDRSTARQLIRFVDNRTIYVSDISTDNATVLDGSPQEDEEEVDLNKLPVFSVPKTSLLKALKEFDENKLDWLFKRVENPQGGKAETYKKPNAKKITITSEKINSAKEVVASFRLIINRKYVTYSKDIGLEINVTNPPEHKENIPKPDRSKQPYKNEYEYYMDTYDQHLKMMWDCWHNKFPPKSSEDKLTYTSIRDELLQAGGRFIREKIFTEATKEEAKALFELLVMFAILTHDLGKLQVKWQQVMRGWQQIAYEKFNFKDPKSYFLAHTDHKPSIPEIKKAYNEFMSIHQRPPHAIKSAFLAEELLESHLLPILEDSFDADEEQIENIFGVIQMAAGRHHSAWAKGWKLSDVAKNETIELVGNANDAIAASWQQLSKSLNLPDSISLPSKPFELQQTTYDAKTIDLNFFAPDSLEYQQLYALVVRALRTCDMRSVQLNQYKR